jgi:hypothetical protein
MIKEICLVRGNDHETHTAFADRILDASRSLAGRDGTHGLKVVLTDKRPPKFSIIPYRKDKVASVSTWHEPGVSHSDITGMEGFSGAFTVDEEIPVGYDKTWNDHEVTPGACLLTLFRQKPGISYETFIHRWHNGHTPLSLKIHPLWNYSRNVVRSSADDKFTWYDGIVEEQVREVSDLLNPFRFFGKPHIIIPRMITVYRDVNSFLDYKGIETYFANEIILKSLSK